MNAPVRVRPPRSEPESGVPGMFAQGANLLKRLQATTPGRMRLLSMLCVALIAVAAVFTTLAALRLKASTERVADNTAPVLIATQDVYASLAEANSAATALDDVEQRGIYEDAIDRASRDLEDVARLVGGDPASHELLKEVNADLTRYVRVMEEARVTGDPIRLSSALEIVENEIAPALRSATDSLTVTNQAKDRFDDDINAGKLELALAFVAAAAALLVLLGSQWWLTGRTNRLLNIPLVLATLVVLAASVLLYNNYLLRQGSLDVARENAYSSIQITGDIQEFVLQYRNEEAQALLAGERGTFTDRQDTMMSFRLQLGTTSAENIRTNYRAGTTGLGVGGLIESAANAADSARERAAVDELAVRWIRYAEVSENINVLLGVNSVDDARELAATEGLDAFAGLNTAIESVLFDNRSQFEDAIDDAGNGFGWLWVISLVLTAVAALLAVWGFSMRIREYR